MLKRLSALGAAFPFLFASTANAFTQTDHQTLMLQKQYLNQINQCAAPASFSRLVNSALRSSNADQKAQLAMTIEEMILQNPACFVEASIKIGKSKCEMIEAMYIQEPHFYPRENLKQSLAGTKLYAQSCFAS